jgi:hypothetical protein
MARFNSSLNDVRVAAPCPANWDEMRGCEQVRFCSQCSLNVYNLSGMSKREAESLIARTEGRLCVRFYKRADGTILTSNCPVGLRAIRRRLSRVVTAIMSVVLSFFAGLGIYTGLSEKDNLPPSRTMGILERNMNSTGTPLEPREVMGRMRVTENYSARPSRINRRLRQSVPNSRR